MLKIRSNEYPDFEHYLQVQQRVVLPRLRRPFYRRLTLGAVLATAGAAFFHFNPELTVAVGLTVPLFGAGWFTSPARFPITPDQETLIRADGAADVFRVLLHKRRLRSSLHPGVGAVLNECAAAWRRIVALSGQRLWNSSERAAYWKASRQDWTRAADLAMAEALIIGESSLTFRAPKSRAEDVIEDIIDNFTAGKLRGGVEPLPIQFRELRDIADKLQMLAREVDSITNGLDAETASEAHPTASRRLEDVLGHLRSIRSAEEELRQQI